MCLLEQPQQIGQKQPSCLPVHTPQACVLYEDRSTCKCWLGISFAAHTFMHSEIMQRFFTEEHWEEHG